MRSQTNGLKNLTVA